MRSVRLALVGLCAALAAGCGDNLKPAQRDGGSVTPPPRDAGPPPTDVASLRFATDVTAARNGKFTTTFPLHTQQDVVILATVPVGTTPRLLRVDVYGPGEVVVETMRVAYAADPAPGTTVVNPTNGPPLRVQKAKPAGSLGQIELGLAVAGTQLTEFGQVGSYTAHAFVDDAVVCSGTFELGGNAP